jgi:hypothetical protein
MNMEQYRRFTQNLGFDAVSRAALTGIALGWLPMTNEGDQELTGACVHCGWCVRHRWTSGSERQRVERLCLTRMALTASENQCVHWRKFAEYFDEGGLHWHNWVVEFTELGPRFRTSTLDERLALHPKPRAGVRHRDLIDQIAVASVLVQPVK